MSVVESTHEQSLVTEASVVFFPMNMLKSVLSSWVWLVTGKWICRLIAMIHKLWWDGSSNFLLLLNKYRMIEKNTVLGLKKEEIYRLCIQTDICSIVRMAKIFYIRRSLDLHLRSHCECLVLLLIFVGDGKSCDKLQRNSEMILIKFGKIN